MVRLMTLTEGRILRAWLAMIKHLREENSVTAIASRLHTDDVLRDLNAAIGKFTSEEHAAFVNAGQQTAKWLNGEFSKSGPVRKKLVAFDTLDPISVRWAQRNSLEKLRELGDEQRSAIREVLIAGARTGDNPLVMAREIRDSIGLTQYQASVVENYRRQLESRAFGPALQRQLTDGRFDRTVTAAMRAERGLTPAQIDTMVERYRSNWVAFRADTIARTEGLRVAHQGTEELYRQAIDNGDIDASQIERTWHHSPGARSKGGPREFHVSMHGQTRSYGEPFVSGIGGRLRFPGDPEAGPEETANCRCTVSTRLLAGSAVRDEGGESADSVGDSEPYASYEVVAPEPLPEFPEFPETLPSYQPLPEFQAELATPLTTDEFRIGVGAIGDEAAIAEADVVMPAVDVVPEPRAPEPQIPVVTVPAGDPYRTAPDLNRDTPVPSDKPAPVGFESVEYNGELYYRHQTTGRAYTPLQYAEREADADRGWSFELTGPNEQIPGYQVREVLSRNMIDQGRPPELRYRSKRTGNQYTREQIDSGEAAEAESFLIEEAANPKPRRGLMARLRSLFGAE